MLQKSALILLSSIIVLVVVEVLARSLFPEFADREMFLNRAYSHLLNSDVRFNPKSDNYSRKFGFALSPNSEHTITAEEFTYTSRTNSIGFRTKDIRSRNAGEYRVMLLGDSMFYGVGVQEPDMVSSVLEQQETSGLSVYNYSVTGYNTVQELLVAEAYTEALSPDHIVLGFFIANDILPNAIAFIDEDGNYSTSADMELMVRNKLTEGLGFLSHFTSLRIIADRIFIPRLRYKLSTDHDLISNSYALLSDIKRFAIAHGAKFSVVIMYPKDSVQGGLMQAWSNSREVGTLINKYCKQNSIEVLDLIDYMNTATHKDRYFFKNDGHPNKQGNAFIAAAIYKNLIQAYRSH